MAILVLINTCLKSQSRQMIHLYEITGPRSSLYLFDVMCAGVLNSRFLPEKAIGFHRQAGLLN